MRRDLYRKDTELSLRMFFTMFLMGLLYVAFLWFLFAIGVDLFTTFVLVAIMLGLQYFFSDKLVLLSMGAKVVSPSQYPQLHSLIERLAAQANLPKPRVAVVDSDIPNAFATGRNPKNAVVAVTTGLMRRLDSGELEAVLGHELTHVKNRDVMVITLASFFATVAYFIMRFAMFAGFFGGFGYGYGRNRSQGPALTLVVFLVALVVWIISFLLIRALSRYREYAADRGGAILTGTPSRLASALLKISGAMARIPQEDLRQVEAMNAFFIVPALKGSSLAELFATHPPVAKRVERLQKLARQLEGM